MSKIYVFDIDGTLANIEHRVHFVRDKPKNWKAFNASIPFDKVYSDIRELLMTVRYTKTWIPDELIDNRIILCSGRGEETRTATEDWLFQHEIPYNKLYMRSAGDYRKDSFVKVELLNQIRAEYGEPFMWIDDRDQVVQAIRAEGVRVLQCRHGDF